MVWYIVPTIICLFIKLSVLWFCRDAKHESKMFIPLVTMIAVLNFVEILGFSQFVKDSSPEFLLRVYYLCFLGVQVYICSYAVELSEIKILAILSKILAIVITSIMATIMFTNHLIIGYKEIGYSITAIKGDYYWVFQVFTIGSLLISMLIMVAGYFSTNKQKTQQRCAYGLLSVSSIVLVMILVVVLQMLGFKMNAMGILPIATTVFVLITLRTETNHNLTDIRRFIPYSVERKSSVAMLKVLDDYSSEKKNFNESAGQLEKLLILYKCEKAGFNISETAKAMDIPRTTLNSMLKRLDIKLKAD